MRLRSRSTQRCSMNLQRRTGNRCALVGYAGCVAQHHVDLAQFNVQLAGADVAPVQEVAIRVKGVDQALMTRVSQGRFTFPFSHKGIAGPTLITFAGKDAQGADFCEYTITVMSKGPRQ